MPTFSLKEARKLKKQKLYGPAIANYMAVLKHLPESSIRRVEFEFVDCFHEFCKNLESDGRVDEANDYFVSLSDVFDNSRRFYSLWGEFLIRNGLREEAALCYFKILSLETESDEYSTKAESALKDLRDQLVDQWHFRMLNDFQRNSSYQLAIEKTLQNMQAATVLDIGCGTGILSMMAAKAGSKFVHACEMSSIMSQIAKTVLVVNGFDHQVSIFDGHSSKFKLPECYSFRNIDLIVVELMDAGFFGEGIVSALFDAKIRLLSKNGLVIPKKVEIYAAVVECKEIRDEHLVETLSNVADLQLKFPLVSRLATRGDEEPYDSAKLKKIKNGYKYLSESQLIYSANLNDLSTLDRLKNGLEFEFCPKMIIEGRKDAVVSWFVVELAEDVYISTEPNIESCWEQAVFPLGNASDECATFKVKIEDDWFRISPTVQKPVREERTFSNSIVLSMINDEITLNSFRLFVESYRQRIEADQSTVNILDITENPLISFVASNLFDNVKANVVSTDEEVRSSLRVILEDNVEKFGDKVEILTVFEDEKQIFSKVDLLLCNPVESSIGLLRQNSLENIAYYKMKYQPRWVVPGRLDVWAMIVESSELVKCARVIDDDVTLGFKIKDIINVFDAEFLREMEFSTLNFVPLTERCRILSLNFNETLTEDSDVLPNFLAQRTVTEMRVANPGRADALLFWYEMSCAECSSLEINTSDVMTKFKNAAYIVKSSFAVMKNDSIAVDATLERSCFRFLINKQ